MATYIAGLDLGQSIDYSALAIVQKYTKKILKHRTPELEPICYLRHLSRFALNTPYPAVVETVDGILSRPELAGDITLAIDSSGMGSAIYDMFKTLKKVRGGNLRYKLEGIKITPGEGRARYENGYRMVPKVELLKPLFAIYGTPRFVIAHDVPDRAEFERQMQSFHYEHSDGGRAKFGAISGMHDDYVIAVSMPLWYVHKPEFVYHYVDKQGNLRTLGDADPNDPESIFELERRMKEEEEPPPDDDENNN